jgi:hypothetical protein
MEVLEGLVMTSEEKIASGDQEARNDEEDPVKEGRM